MKKTIQPFLFLFIFLTTVNCFSKPIQKRFLGFPDNNRGWAFIAGEPIYTRYSLFTNWKRAINFSVGFSFNKLAMVSADHVWYFYDAEDKVRDVDFWNSLLFYLGGGLKLGVGTGGHDPNDNPQIGLRIVTGTEYIFVGSPWSLRFEIVPEINFKGRSAFNIAAGVGITYYMGGGAQVKQRKSNVNYDPSEFD